MLSWKHLIAHDTQNLKSSFQTIIWSWIEIQPLISSSRIHGASDLVKVGTTPAGEKSVTGNPKRLRESAHYPLGFGLELANHIKPEGKPSASTDCSLESKKEFKKQPQKILLAHSWFSIMPKLKGFDSFCNGIFDPEGDNYFWWRPGWLRWWGNWRLAEGSRACQMEACQIGSLFV